MKSKNIYMLMILFVTIFSCDSAFSQTKNMGLIYNNSSKSYDGYTLFAPKQYTSTYLINNEGKLIHSWNKSQYPPGQSVYLLENGHLLRSCMTKGQLSSGGGEGGRIEEYDWDDNLVWYTDFSTATYMQHHDIKRLPNGNIIMLVIEKKTYDEVVAAGFNPTQLQSLSEVQSKGFLPDYVAEIKPNYTTGVGYTLIWEWHAWDHLIQSYDATKNNYGVPKNHPELIDCAGDQTKLPTFWNHMNSIDYHPVFDQIALSVRGNSEVWIIDHSTTTVEAAGHTGGKRGKGGDLLYRWGNPVTYGAGTKSDQRYFQQHDVEWIKTGYPGAGNLTCFNNGLNRPGVSTNYSSADEFTPAVDANGNYTMPTLTGSAFLPSQLSWSFFGNDYNNKPLYSENISGAYRLPNGNTLICSGTIGIFVEVTSSKEIVWQYICPVDQYGPMTEYQTIPEDAARAGELMNSVFRVYRYPKDYAAFTGRTLAAGSTIEKYSTAVDDKSDQLPSSFQLMQNYPNPFNPETVISYQLSEAEYVSLKVYNILGEEVAKLVDEYQQAGLYNSKFSIRNSQLSSGVYFYTIRISNYSQTKKMLLMK